MGKSDYLNSIFVDLISFSFLLIFASIQKYFWKVSNITLKKRQKNK